eukprot:CAMPEP_0198109034 /NCGR_PEP_ID=MMETSP1442-20131203/1048_1 /TAXON_ID= /ORGANISM="Craspedostauros australis, Strain CCMP3328" /LENGTH=428 /DNA_ID=CAMNT_0043764505 /DNA_START=47 /DNA_END=1334 /DNA_ORIENTATION=-
MDSIMARMLQPIKSIFDNKLVLDDREPAMTFELPGFDGTFGLLMPEGELWLQLGALISLQTGLQCLFGAIIYTLIIKPRKAGSKDRIAPQLLGWGIIFPIAAYASYLTLEVLDVRNKVIKMAAGTFSTVVCFRVIEAMYETPASPAVETSLGHYAAYYSTPVPCIWDAKTMQRVKGAPYQTLKTTLFTLWHFVLVSFTLSFLAHFDYKPFPNDPVELDSTEFSFDLFTPQHLANAYCQILMLYSILFIGFNGSALSPQLQGFATVPIFTNPMLTSRSATEFWTQRWNMMIHALLKHGIFRPLQKCVPLNLAILLTFVASGVFHDYSWSTVFYKFESCGGPDGVEGETCYDIVLGRTTIFFFLTGLLLLLERPFLKLPGVASFAKALPTPIISTLLVLAHAPFAHLYYGAWITGGYVDDFALASSTSEN